jgi:hypothetical protein
MSIGMSQSKELNSLRSLTLKIKPKNYLKYLPSPTYLVPLNYLNIDFNSFWPKFKIATWHIGIRPCVTIQNHLK